MSKNKTTEEFIEQAKKVHGNKYNYSKVDYKHSQMKVCIICPIHGDFWQTPSVHLSGSGCSQCAYKTFTKDISTFIKQAKEIHKEKYNYSKVQYINSDTKVCIICPEHGEFWQTPNKHLHGRGCPKCAGNEKSNTDEFIKKAQLIHGNKYDYSETVYIAAAKKVKIICPLHGEFYMTGNNHLRGQGCGKCANNVKLETSEFIEKAKEIHGDKYDYSKVNYVNRRTEVCIICPECGEFQQTPNSHLAGNGCPKCKGWVFNTEDFIDKAKKVHSDKYDYSKVDYKTSIIPVCIICPKHGEFWQTPNKHLGGCGCPKCTLTSQTKLFEKLQEILQEELIWEYNVEWLGKQRIDIFIPKYNIGIEYQGIQHYKPIEFFGGEKRFKMYQQLDILKLEKCNKNGVALLYIRYDYSEEEFNELVGTIKNIIDTQLNNNQALRNI